MKPNLAPNGFDQFLRIEPNSVPEYQPDLFDVRNLPRGVAVQDNQIGLLAAGDGPDVVVQAQEFCAVESRDLNRLGGPEAARHQQFDIALIAEAGQRASVAGMVTAGHQQTTRFHKGALELQLLLDAQGAGGTRLLGKPVAAAQIKQCGGGRQSIQKPRLQRRRHFEDRQSGSHRHLVLDQLLNGSLHGFAIDIQLRQLLRGSGWASVPA